MYIIKGIEELNENYKINDTYQLTAYVGKGGNGIIYTAKDIDKQQVIVKFNKDDTLYHEYQIYELLKNDDHFPKFYHYLDGAAATFSFSKILVDVMILEDCGKSLSFYLSKYKKLTIQNVYICAIQTLNCLKALHQFNIVHGDVKPGNFVVRNGKIVLIDFGLSSVYIIEGQHRPFGYTRGFCGTVQYASIYAHHLILASRRDDLLSLVYVLIKLLRGVLPWTHLIIKKEVMQSKRLEDQLLTQIPQAIKDMYCDLQKLKYKQPPNYDLLIQLFILSSHTLNLKLTDALQL